MEAPRVLATMWADDDPWWNGQVDLLDRRTLSYWRFILRFFRVAPRYDAVIVVGSLGARHWYMDVVATIALRLRRRRPVVVVTDATWEPTSAALAARLRLGRFSPLLSVPARLAIRLVDHPKVRFVVLSSEELRQFPRTWGVPPHRVRMTTFPTSLHGRIDDRTSDGGYLFAGGNSLRDYETLLEAVRGMDLPVRIAAAHVPQPLPPNVTAGPVSPHEFTDLLLGASLVVVPLRPAIRSAGQQTYLNAMAVRKPVIVFDAPGVRDLVRHGENGLIVAPDAAELRAAIEWVLDPANAEQVGRMVEVAHREARELHSPASYRRRIWQIARDAVTEDRAGSRAG